MDEELPKYLPLNDLYREANDLHSRAMDGLWSETINILKRLREEEEAKKRMFPFLYETKEDREKRKYGYFRDDKDNE